jgi:hypothetical protein
MIPGFPFPTDPDSGQISIIQSKIFQIWRISERMLSLYDIKLWHFGLEI